MNSLEFAVNMELEGEKYYAEQAELNKDNSLQVVFLMLAKDEKYHAELLQSKFSGSPYQLLDNSTLTEAKNIFDEIGDFKSEVKSIPEQLEVYKDAMKKEKQSIDLYEKLQAEAADDKSKKLFDYLIEQETEHLELFEELVIHVNRPNDWVESAEFGERDEY